jgi:hypothetical protein
MTKKMEYIVVSVNEFIKVTHSGEFDREETRRSLPQFAELIAASGCNHILLDTREAFTNPPLTFFDIYRFVEELGKHGATLRNKIAVLTRKDAQFDNAKFFELCAGNRGFDAQAFTSFEEAINWFSKMTNAKEVIISPNPNNL